MDFSKYDVPEGITIKENLGIGVVFDRDETILGNVWPNEDGTWSANGEPAATLSEAIELLRRKAGE